MTDVNQGAEAPKEELTEEQIAEQLGGEVKDNDGWEDVGSDLGKTIRWTEVARNEKEEKNTIFIGNQISGIYRERKDNIGMNSATLYQIETVDHGLLNIWSTTVLADKMKRVWEGNEVVIISKGEQVPKAGGKAYMLFDVKQRPASEELIKKLEAKSGTKKGEINVEEVPFD